MRNGHTCARRTQVITSHNEKDNRVPGTEIPIFTTEFLAHTKGLCNYVTGPVKINHASINYAKLYFR